MENTNNVTSMFKTTEGPAILRGEPRQFLINQIDEIIAEANARQEQLNGEIMVAKLETRTVDHFTHKAIGGIMDGISGILRDKVFGRK